LLFMRLSGVPELHVSQHLQFCRHFKLCKPPSAIEESQLACVLCTPQSVYRYFLKKKPMSEPQRTVMEMVDAMLLGHEWVWEAHVLVGWNHPVDIVVLKHDIIIQVDGEGHTLVPHHNNQLSTQLGRDMRFNRVVLEEGRRCVRLHHQDVASMPEICQGLIGYAMQSKLRPFIILSPSYDADHDAAGGSMVTLLAEELNCSHHQLQQSNAIGYVLTL